MSRSRLIIGGLLGLAAVVVVFLVLRGDSGFQRLKEDGLRLAARGDFGEAEPLLKGAAERDPSDVDVLKALSKGYIGAERKAEAEECLGRWLVQAPSDPEPLLLRIELYRDLGRFSAALVDLQRLLEIDPRNVAWRRKQVALLYSASRYDQAEAECRRCLEAQPGDRGLERTLAEIKKAQGKPAEAGAILDGMLREAPNDTATMAARAILHLTQDEPAKAIPLLRTVIRVDPNRQRSGRYYLGLALNRVGETEEAERLLDEVRRAHDAGLLLIDSAGQPKNLPLQVRAARAQFENNDLRKSTEILASVLRIDPDYAPAHILLADVLEKEGRFVEAAEHRRRTKGHP
ncbi:MAG: tetratricopeptide repeat protein [Gemmataceae bacterium]